jgi:hypothetical protein
MDEYPEMPDLGVVRRCGPGSHICAADQGEPDSQDRTTLPVSIQFVAACDRRRLPTGQIGSVSPDPDSGCRCISAVRQMLLFKQSSAERVC